MRLPFIRYIEALVACKYPADQIYDTVGKLNVTLADQFPKEGIVEIWNRMAKEDEDYYTKPGTIPKLGWLEDYGIDKLVAHEKKLQTPKGTAGMKGAFEILNDSNMYEVVTSMALAKINQEDIELIMNGKFNIHYDSDDINEFLNYFFDVADWSLSEKRIYVDLVKDSSLKKYYGYALEGDKDYLIWKLGLAPDKSFDAMLRDMGTDTYYYFKERMQKFPDEAQRWGQLMLRITDRLEKLDKETTDKKNAFDFIQFTINVDDKDKKGEKSSEPSLKKGPLTEEPSGAMPHLSELTAEEETNDKD